MFTALAANLETLEVNLLILKEIHPTYCVTFYVTSCATTYIYVSIVTTP